MRTPWKCCLLPGECLVIARENRRYIPTRTIAFRAMISSKRVWIIARKKSWDDIMIGEATRYLSACGITTDNIAFHVDYLKRTLKSPNGFAHLRHLPKKIQKKYAELL